MVESEEAAAAPAVARPPMWVMKPALSLLWFAGTFVFASFVLLRLRICVADDAYIHGRITDNLLHFGHPWFNPGDRVMSTSSPIWNLLVAGIERMLPSWKPILFIEALSTSVTSLCAVILVRAERAGNRGGWAWATTAQGAVVAGSLCLLIPVAAEQMETAFALGLLVSAVVLLDRWPGFALGLLVVAGFVRYEVVGCLILVVVYLAFQRRLKAQVLLGPALALGAILTWLVWNFHTIVPNTIRAKKLAYITNMLAVSHFAFSANRTLSLVELPLFGALCILLLLSLRSGWRTYCRENALGLLLFTFGAGTWFVYVVSKTFIFDWYRPILLFPLVCGAIVLFVRSGSWLRAGTSLIFVAFACFPGPLFILSAVRNEPRTVPGYSWYARVHTYQAIGSAVNDVCPNARLMSSEIGGLGASFHGYIYDGLGLTDPDALKFHPMRVPEERSSGAFGAIPVGYVMEKQPDVIVSYDQYGEAVLRSAAVRGAYFDRAFPPFLPIDSSPALLRTFQGIRSVHVLVKQNGGCDRDQLYERIARDYASLAPIR
jgi:hypothetical protein